jgi:hypothetical protein
MIEDPRFGYFSIQDLGSESMVKKPRIPVRNTGTGTNLTTYDAYLGIAGKVCL